MFGHAIVRPPGKSLVNGITSANLGKPDFNKSLEQHDRYCEALKACGLMVHRLEPDEIFPDSTFVEDTALLTAKMAVLTNPGAPSRRGETASIYTALSALFPIIETIQHPGTVEGGDVMMVGDRFYIGLSARTNRNGADQLIRIIESHGYSGTLVPLTEMLHMKTGLAYLENNNLLISGEFVDNSLFSNFHRIEVPAKESYAANSIWVNGTVIMPAGFRETHKKISALGYAIIECDMSEFQKLDGGLSCLSLRF